MARYIRLEPGGDEAEIAVTVLDDWQGQGLGRLLLEAVADRAREEGIATLTASVLAQNPGAMHVISGLGDDAGTSRRGEVVELRVALPEEEGIGGDLGTLLQAAAGGSIVVLGAVLRAAAGADAVPHGERAPLPAAGVPTRIVVGSDGSATAAQAVAEAATLAAGLGASLHVVSAYYGAAAGVLPAGLRAVPEGVSDLGWMIATADDARAVVDGAKRTALAAGVEATGEARRGDPASVLVAVAGERGADLVVVGSKGLRGARRFLLGGVAEKVVRHAPCSVLIARTG
nr:GNAT family N-acetyltransferase [Patulibacter sp. DM4]